MQCINLLRISALHCTPLQLCCCFCVQWRRLVMLHLFGVCIHVVLAVCKVTRCS